jgi:hypothetical protein
MTKTNISTCERKDTAVCTFDKETPKILAFDIHEWIYEHLRTNENENTTIQTDGLIRQVFIKFTQTRELRALFDSTKGTAIYKLVTCGISRVRLCPLAWARLLPEMPADVIQRTLHKFGTVQEITDEKWSTAYR